MPPKFACNAGHPCRRGRRVGWPERPQRAGQPRGRRPSSGRSLRSLEGPASCHNARGRGESRHQETGRGAAPEGDPEVARWKAPRDARGCTCPKPEAGVFNLCGCVFPSLSQNGRWWSRPSAGRRLAARRAGGKWGRGGGGRGRLRRVAGSWGRHQWEPAGCCCPQAPWGAPGTMARQHPCPGVPAAAAAGRCPHAPGNRWHPTWRRPPAPPAASACGCPGPWAPAGAGQKRASAPSARWHPVACLTRPRGPAAARRHSGLSTPSSPPPSPRLQAQRDAMAQVHGAGWDLAGLLLGVACVVMAAFIKHKK